MVIRLMIAFIGFFSIWFMFPAKSLALIIVAPIVIASVAQIIAGVVWFLTVPSATISSLLLLAHKPTSKMALFVRFVVGMMFFLLIFVCLIAVFLKLTAPNRPWF